MRHQTGDTPNISPLRFNPQATLLVIQIMNVVKTDIMNDVKTDIVNSKNSENGFPR